MIDDAWHAEVSRNMMGMTDALRLDVPRNVREENFADLRACIARMKARNSGDTAENPYISPAMRARLESLLAE